MKKLIACSIAIVVFLLVGCGARGPKLASSAEDIAGTTWFSNFGGPFYIQFFEDGTFHMSSDRDLVAESPSEISETRFEFFPIEHSVPADFFGVISIEPMMLLRPKTCRARCDFDI